MKQFTSGMKGFYDHKVAPAANEAFEVAKNSVRETQGKSSEGQIFAYGPIILTGAGVLGLISLGVATIMSASRGVRVAAGMVGLIGGLFGVIDGIGSISGLSDNWNRSYLLDDCRPCDDCGRGVHTYAVA